MFKKNGVTADDEGYIYMLDTKSSEITDTLAINQLFTDKYYIFEVYGGGFSADVEPDLVGEFTAPHHARLKQPDILPIFIKSLGKRKVDVNRVQNYTANETQKLVDRLNKKK